ncbi:NLR family CARD domain-containing protein 3 [Denticeps clupeoides]|uniref:CARD domain-containing protein n=1 Tax=Denticeps clupeoides TaxID=299321 RepID=A0AAY4AL30_9TELE|nr:NLR family CARD domain-containing protein 3 [Denticeps clupeoides]
MERHTHIPWQDDPYIDVTATPPKARRGEKEAWLHKHRKALQLLITARLLEAVLSHLKKAECLTDDETGFIRHRGTPQDRVLTLLELLSIKDPQGTVLQTFLQTSYPQEFQVICQYDSMIKQQKELIYKHFREVPGSPSYTHVKQTPITEDPAIGHGLLVVEGLTDLQEREHDLTQLSVTRGGGPLHGRPLRLDRLLLPLTHASPSPRVCLTVGVAGSGKSRLVRRFVNLWSKGCIHQEITLVLPVACWELGAYDRLSADRMMRMLLPSAAEGVEVGGACKVLLVIDGLEEFRSPLNFADTAPTSDPKREIPIADLFTNIIRGNLLPGAMLWLLCRPGVGARIPAGLVDRVTEVPPLSHTNIRYYLHTRSFTHTLNEQLVWSHLTSQKPLLVLCSIPAICRTVTDTLLCLVEDGTEDKPLPQTLTEVYAHYCWPLPQSSDWSRSSARKQLGALGKLAFYSLLRGRHTHTESEARAYGLDLPPPPGTLGCRVLQREASVYSGPGVCVWRFTHLSLQEFLAAVFYYSSSRRAMFDLFSESGVSWPRLGFSSHYRAALQRAEQLHAAAQKADQSNTAANLQLFQSFLTGLLSPAIFEVLGVALGISRDEHSAHRVAVATALQLGVAGIGGGAVTMHSVSLVACLAEMRQTELLRSVEDDLIGCRLQGKLTPPTCAVLAYLLQVSAICTDDTNLSSCLDHSALKKLLPQLLYCNNLRLDCNELKDDAMDLLGSLLSAKDCHIQILSLADNFISNKGAKPLSRALLVNRTLTGLDLRGNNIGSKGAKSLAEALKMNHVIVSINLQNNHIEDEGARALAEVLQSNRKLISLNLQKNSITADGVKRIAESLKKNQTLKELNISSNQVGDAGAAALAQALTINHSLQSLRLQSSSVSDRGVTALTQALRLNHGLTSLILRENSVRVDGARALARALQDNHTLEELDLTANLLHDEGVTAVAAAVKVNRALVSLHLQWNFMKSGAAQALAHSLLSNTHLKLLDLQENTLGDEGVVSLATALKTNSTLCVLYLQGVSAGRAGAVALAEALMVNKTLHTLDLRGNSVGMGGAKALSSALKTNRSLRSLNLQENALGMDGAIFIATALKGNHQLTYINLQSNNIGESGAKVVSEHIRADAPECVVDI